MSYKIVSIGCYNTKKEADKRLKSISDSFPSAFVEEKELQPCVSVFHIVLDIAYKKVDADRYARLNFKKENCVVIED